MRVLVTDVHNLEFSDDTGRTLKGRKTFQCGLDSRVVPDVAEVGIIIIVIIVITIFFS